MKLLLDTHIWVWRVLEPERLSARVARQLTNPEYEIWLSAVSVWELLLFHEKGRVQLIPDAVSWIKDNLGRLNIREAPLTFEVALAISSLQLPSQRSRRRFYRCHGKSIWSNSGDRR